MVSREYGQRLVINSFVFLFLTLDLQSLKMKREIKVGQPGLLITAMARLESYVFVSCKQTVYVFDSEVSYFVVLLPSAI